MMEEKRIEPIPEIRKIEENSDSDFEKLTYIRRFSKGLKNIIIDGKTTRHKL